VAGSEARQGNCSLNFLSSIRPIGQRDTRAPFIMRRFYGLEFTRTPHWPPLAKTMNLPEDVL